MKKNILYIVSSVVFSLVLFVYATSSDYQMNNFSQNTSSEMYRNTIAGVPIDVSYDREKFFVSGFSSEVSVKLTGSNRVNLTTETQESTRNFHVVADLRRLKPGVHTVPLGVNNLPNGLSAIVTPDHITVKIGPKATRMVEVRPMILNSNQLAKDIEVKSISISENKVKVTSDKETLSKIDHVEVLLPQNEVISGNIDIKALLQAVDKEGNVLASVIDPEKVSMKITTKAVSTS